MAVRSASINVMVAAAMKVARALNRDFGEIEQLQTSRSGSTDFTERSFQHGARILVEALAHAKPHCKTYIIGASTSPTVGSFEEAWVASPISGRINFAHGIPHFAVSIAYVVGNQTKSSIVYDFINDNLYWAEKGAGSYRNDRRIRVSKRQNPKDMIVGNFELATGDIDWEGARLKVSQTGIDVRILGSIALDLAFVASGVLDGFWSFSAEPSEFLSGKLLIAEAGGLMNRDIAGSSGRGITGPGMVASNGLASETLSRILAQN